MSLEKKAAEEKILEIKVRDSVFMAKRPSYTEVGIAFAKGATDAEISKKYVTGWRNVRERDLILGGSNDLVPFSRSLFDSVIEDIPEVYNAVAQFLVDQAIQHKNALEEQRKN